MKTFKDYFNKKTYGISDDTMNGFWIKPNREIVEVGFYGHSQYLEDHWRNDDSDDAINNGWTRIGIFKNAMAVRVKNKDIYNNIYDIVYKLKPSNVTSIKVIDASGNIINESIKESMEIKQEGKGLYKIVLDDIGYAILHTEADDDYIWLSSIYVSPEYRNKGYFKQLMDKVVDIKRKYFINRPIKIRVYPFKDEPKSEDELISIYKKYGFKETDKKGYLIYENV